ncbi:MAG TPA: NADP-dependent isocitrate dehydrogenase, partial [Candidatus Rifleibacterium sp.]|nr:NADP-dependent isocitrate dehydrogenase [Candidatus Rifleibacterium sp.]
FAALARDLAEKHDTIIAEVNAARNKPLDIGGYYLPETRKVTQAMRPSQTFNKILEKFMTKPAEARCASTGA